MKKYLCTKSLFIPYSGEQVFTKGRTYTTEGCDGGPTLRLLTPCHDRVSAYPVKGDHHDWSDFFTLRKDETLVDKYYCGDEFNKLLPMDLRQEGIFVRSIVDALDDPVPATTGTKMYRCTLGGMFIVTMKNGDHLRFKTAPPYGFMAVDCERIADLLRYIANKKEMP